MNNKTCKTCRHWQRIETRIYAKISDSPGPVTGLHELRLCGYRPPPTITTTFKSVYTNEDYSCDQWTKE